MKLVPAVTGSWSACGLPEEAPAKVGLFRRGQKALWHRVHADGRYLSSSDIRVHFGLGDSRADLESPVVEWPGGEAEIWKDIRMDTLVTPAAEGR
jgi:hypothetical protein